MNQSQSSSKRSPYISEMTRSEFTTHLSTEEHKLKRTLAMANMQISVVTVRYCSSGQDAAKARQDLARDLLELRRPANSEPQLRPKKIVSLRNSVSEGDAQRDTGMYCCLRNENWQTLTASQTTNQRHQLFQVYLRA
jgi:hypothetical protein